MLSSNVTADTGHTLLTIALLPNITLRLTVYVELELLCYML